MRLICEMERMLWGRYAQGLEATQLLVNDSESAISTKEQLEPDDNCATDHFTLNDNRSCIVKHSPPLPSPPCARISLSGLGPSSVCQGFVPVRHVSGN